MPRSDQNSGNRLLSVVILTRDEEMHLRALVESFAPLNSEIFIVDSGSTDKTRELARELGCRVYEHPWETYAVQFNWALDNLPFRTPWVMRMDADEWLTPELAAEIMAALPSAAPETVAFMVKRRVYFWGRWIRHGGYYPIWLLRIWRTGCARSEERWMDEHMVLTVAGSIVRLRHDLVDENRKGLGFWTDKHNRYADREVKDILAASAYQDDARPAGQMGFRRWAKEKVYARMPLFLRPFLYWSYRYFILLGFLDGRPGLIFHFLQGFWYRLLIDAKLYEKRLNREESTIDKPAPSASQPSQSDSPAGATARSTEAAR
jgi:glycosyltransferase involved in cell wall biosynthesis